MTLEEFVARLEAEILGESQLTVDDVLALSGTERADAEELWMNLGFASVDVGEVRFTDADVAALRSLGALRAEGLAEPEVIVPLARVMGQALSRVASAQMEAFRQPVLDALATPGFSDDDLTEVTRRLLDGFGEFIAYVWRRQLAVAARRSLLEGGSDLVVVGFVDLVGYTRETRDLDDDDLSDVLDRFHRTVYDQVTSVDGRVVKVIGDGALFVTGSADDAAVAALGMVSAVACDERLRGVRVGLATGRLVAIDGDIYGATVNRASRLSDHARPHTILVDDATGEALSASGSIRAKRTKPHRLKGLGTENTWVVRSVR